MILTQFTFCQVESLHTTKTRLQKEKRTKLKIMQDKEKEAPTGKKSTQKTIKKEKQRSDTTPAIFCLYFDHRYFIFSS